MLLVEWCLTPTLAVFQLYRSRAHVGGRRSRLVAAHFAFSRPKREVEVAL